MNLDSGFFHTIILELPSFIHTHIAEKNLDNVIVDRLHFSVVLSYFFCICHMCFVAISAFPFPLKTACPMWTVKVQLKLVRAAVPLISSFYQFYNFLLNDVASLLLNSVLIVP